MTIEEAQDYFAQTGLHIFRQDRRTSETGQLQAAPFACLTDYPLVADGSAAGGFRFFFSSYPRRLLQTIKGVLTVWQAFNELLSSDASSEELVALSGKIQESKFDSVEGIKIGHSILEDIRLPEKPTYLAFMR
ncbi:MAG: hypothetical protein KKD13_03900 [Candidatus Margulisbacteria bacterium]|nr:hypothetical protein [Candidatus Margulisiibacteriota bacterium]